MLFRQFRLKRRNRKLVEAYKGAADSLILSLYKLFVSILRDDCARICDDDTIKSAAAFAINEMCRRPDKRKENPANSHSELLDAIGHIKQLTMITEACALIILFDYYASASHQPQALEAARSIGGPDFGAIERMTDPGKANPKMIGRLSWKFCRHFLETAQFDIAEGFDVDNQ